MSVERITIIVDEKGARVVKRSIEDIGKESEKSSSSVSGLKKAIGLLASSLAVLKLGGLVSEATKLNQRYKELGTSLTVVGRNVGLTRAEMDDAATSIRKMGISMIESRQAILKLATANIDLTNATKLADLARNAAIVGQLNTSDTLNRIVNAIRAGEVEILKTIGLNVQFEQGYKTLAEQLGKSTKELTALEKQTARVNLVLAEGPKLIGLYEASMGNAGKQFRSTERLVEDLKVKLGEVFDNSAKLLVESYTFALKDLDSTVNDLTESGAIEEWGDNIALTLALVVDTARGVDSAFQILGKSIGAVAAQAVAIANFDFKAVGVIQDALELDIQKELDGLDKFQAAVKSSIIQRELLTDAVTGTSAALKKKEIILDKEPSGTLKASKESKEFVKALKSELAALGKTEKELRKMEAAKLGVLSATDQLIDKLFEEKGALDQVNDDIEKAARITESVATSTEVYASELTDLNRLLKDGRISLITYQRAVVELDKEFDELSNSAESAFEDIDQFAIQAARNMQSAFADFLFDPFEGGLKGMLKSFKNIIKRMLAEIVASRILRGFGSIASGGTFSQGVFGGGKDGGGFGLQDVFNIGSSANTANNASNLFAGEALFGTETIGSFVSAIGESIGFASVEAFGAGLSGASSAGVFGPSGLGFLGGEGTAIGATAEFSGTAAAGAEVASVGAGGTGGLAAAEAGLSSTGIGALIVAAALLVQQSNKFLANNKTIGGQNSDKLNSLSSTFDSPAGFFGSFSSIGTGRVLADIFGDVPILGDIFAAVNTFIPNVSSLVTALFGRGPLEQKESVFRSKFGAEGITGGSLQTNFSAKGGVFRSNKNDFVRTDLTDGSFRTDNSKLSGFEDPLRAQAASLTAFIDANIKGFTSSLRETADATGISTEALDAFAGRVNIVSEKGKNFTDEQISVALEKIATQLADSFAPALSNVAVEGETTFVTLQRVASEFVSLRGAVQILGRSLSTSVDVVKGLSLESRDSIIKGFGGIDQFNQKMTFFADNFLTQSQRIQIVTENVNKGLEEFGITVGSTTIEQFGELLKSFIALGEEGLKSSNVLFSIAPGFIQVREAMRDLEAQTDSLAASTNRLLNAGLELTGLSQQLIKSVNAERNNITKQFGDNIEKVRSQIEIVSDSVSRLTALSDALSSATEQINPQSLAEARDNIRAAIVSATKGNVVDLDKVKSSLEALSNKSSNTFSTRAGFQISQAKNVSLLNQLEILTDTQLSVEEENLESLNGLAEQLETDFSGELLRLDNLLISAQDQINVLNDIDDSVLTVADALKSLDLGRQSFAAAKQVVADQVEQNRAFAAAEDALKRGGEAVSPEIIAANFEEGKGFTDSQIKEGVATLSDPFEVFRQAQIFNISADRLVGTSLSSGGPGLTLDVIQDFIAENNLAPLASFDRGGVVPSTGIAMVHKGDNIIGPKENKEIVKLLKELIISVEKGNISSEKAAQILDDVSAGGGAFLTEAA